MAAKIMSCYLRRRRVPGFLPALRELRFIRLGRSWRVRDASQVVVLRSRDGKSTALESEGWEHFSR